MQKPKNPQLISFEEVKAGLLKEKSFRDEYYKEDPDFETATMVIRARIARGLTQKDLAQRIGTKQPSIARLESGLYTTSLKLLRAVANALNVNLEVRFLDMGAFGITKHTTRPTIDLSDKIAISSTDNAENNSEATR